MKNYLYLIFIIAFAIFLILARRGKYTEFHNAMINGKIDTIYRYRDYVMIYVNNIEFRIIPIPLSNSPQLDYIAKKGDKLYKRAGIDTLTLVKYGDKTFTYKVQKY